MIERVAEQRFAGALASVSALRAEHPDDTPDRIADRLIRRYAKDMAIGGAVAGGAAAAPVAGMAVAAASVGVESAFSAGRLGELIMAIGIAYGHAPSSVDERRNAVLAVMGMADGIAVGMSGLAARAGSRGGARVLRRLPSPAPAAAGAGIGRKALNRAASARGPWSVAALVPYGIGAGVGAAGNALLARAVGRAAKEYFGHGGLGDGATGEPVVEPDVVDGEVVDGWDGTDPHPPTPPGAADDDIHDAHVVDEPDSSPNPGSTASDSTVAE